MIKLTDLLSEKIKPKQKISKKEWSKIKKFNKHIGQDGTHYVTQLDKRLGTILVPVVVEGKLTEKKELDSKEVKYIATMTDRNNHTEARIILSKLMKWKMGEKFYKAMEQLRDVFNGYGPELSKLNQKMEKELYRQLLRTYKNYDDIYNAL
tara:strand:+ start:196 stop:648 length:453 start_codon:yes stop_codon:yes gene_type:complete